MLKQFQGSKKISQTLFYFDSQLTIITVLNSNNFLFIDKIVFAKRIENLRSIIWVLNWTWPRCQGFSLRNLMGGAWNFYEVSPSSLSTFASISSSPVRVRVCSSSSSSSSSSLSSPSFFSSSFFSLSDVWAIIFRMQEAIHPVSYFWLKVGNQPASCHIAEVAWLQ